MADSKKGLVPRTQPQGNLSKDPLFAPPTEDELRGVETIDFGQGENPLFAPPTKEELSADYFDAADVPTGQVSGELGAADRAKLSFASNENEKINYLLKKYPGAMIGRTVGGEGESKGDLVIQIPGEKGFKYIDSPALTGADVADFAGDIPEVALGTLGAAALAPSGPAGLIAGSAAGSGLGTTAKKAIGRQLLDVDTPVGLSDVGDVALSTALGAAGAAVPVAVKGFIAKRAAAKAASVADDVAKQGAGLIDDVGPTQAGELFKDPAKAGQRAAEVLEASKKLGIEPTPGMLSTDVAIRGQESMLEQMPSYAGRYIRERVGAARAGISRAVDKLTASKVEADTTRVAQGIRQGLVDKFDDLYKPFKASYESIRQNTKNIAVDPKRIKSAQKFINQYADDELLGNPAAERMVRAFGQKLNKVETIDQLNQVMSAFQKSARNSRDIPAGAIAPIRDRLMSLHDRSVISAAVKAARSGEEGADLGKGLVKKMLETRKSYRGFKELVDTFADTAKIPGIKKGMMPMEFMEKLAEVEDDQLFKAMSGVRDVKVMRFMSDLFPEQFKQAKGVQLAQMIQKSTDKTPEGLDIINPGKFLKELKNAAPSPTERAYLLGEKMGKIPTEDAIKSLETIVLAMPSKMGPSGTPQGMGFVELIMSGNASKAGLMDWVEAQGKGLVAARTLKKSEAAARKAAEAYVKRSAISATTGGMGRTLAEKGLEDAAKLKAARIGGAKVGAGAGLLGSQLQGLLKQKESGR